MDLGGSLSHIPTELSTDYLDSKLSIRGAVRQIWASLAVHSMVIIVGMTLGFSAILVPRLQEPGSDIEISKSDASWIASTVPVVAPIGSLLAGPVMHTLGSRATIRIALAPYALGWLLITFASGLPMLLIGRLITGFATTFGNTPCIVYITEISSPHLRTMLTATGPVMVSLGILIVYFTGWLLPWRVVAGIAAVGNLFCFIMMCTIPESPVWLVARGRKEEAHKALLWFNRVPAKGRMKPKRRISTLETVVEMNEMEHCKDGDENENEAEWARRRMRAEAELRFLLAEHKRKECGFNNNQKTQADEQLLQKSKEKASEDEKRKASSKEKQTLHRLWLLFTLPTCYKPMIILFVLFFLQQFSGIYIMLFYAVGVFEEMGGGSMNAYIASILVGVIRFSMSLINIWLFKAFGRRPLCILSACGMAIAMLVSGISIYNTTIEEPVNLSHVERRMVTSQIPMVQSELPFNFTQISTERPNQANFTLPQNISGIDLHFSSPQTGENVTSSPEFFSRNHVLLQESSTLKPINRTNSPKNYSQNVNNIRTDMKSPLNKTYLMDKNYTEVTEQDPFLSEGDEDVQILREKRKSIIPAICMLLYVCVSMTGLLAIPWTLTAELFPTEVRGLAHSLTLTLVNLLLFASLHLYPHMLDEFGAYGVLWFFSAVSAAAAIFVYFFLPETRNKTLSEIEEYFHKNTIYTLSSKK
ncbi:hypothetical protein J437_LFUL005017 [Ladona fulva]|uniref:Major facilitator superfamily (MFS) profile domain-containing protein n=1 Tax=Ladona fulva TaxID=123851 RepID=A0A8K0JUC9_LADFU|nr:hypothetical protein J437_LFUL005017 [Ladona fulva]